jgi:hypothetical protein
MLQKKLNQALERRLYAIVDAVGNAVGNASLPLGTVEHQILGSAELRPAIAPASIPTPQEPTVKEAFMAELQALGIEPSKHGAIIGKELWDMGYKGDRQGKGNSNLIPIDKIKGVAQAIATGIKFQKSPRKLDEELVAQAISSSSRFSDLPQKLDEDPEPVDGDDEWETVESTIVTESTI